VYMSLTDSPSVGLEVRRGQSVMSYELSCLGPPKPEGFFGTTTKVPFGTVRFSFIAFSVSRYGGDCVGNEQPWARRWNKVVVVSAAIKQEDLRAAVRRLAMALSKPRAGESFAYFGL
jgi:hypothetical protein